MVFPVPIFTKRAKIYSITCRSLVTRFTQIAQRLLNVTELILTKLMFSKHLCVKNFCTEFHENPTIGIYTETRSQKDRQTDRQTNGWA